MRLSHETDILNIESQAVMNKYGQNLCYIRKKLSLSEQKLADFWGVTIEKIYDYELGRNDMSLQHVEKLCRHYGIEFDLFFEDLSGAATKEGCHKHVKEYKSSN